MAAGIDPRRAQEAQRATMSSMMITLVTMFILIAILPFYPMISAFMGPYIYAALGLGGKYPIVTIMLMAVILGGLTTLLRELVTDWRKMIRYQCKMNQWMKAYREAVQKKNTYMIKKLQEAQLELLSEQAEVMKKQQYLYPVTMVIIIPMFAGLYGALYQMAGGSSTLIIALPWEQHWNLFDTKYVFPNWILIYSGVSLIFGTALTNIINYLRLRRILKRD
ncbi:MAG: hypothetical protein DRN30_00690 [Thermoplasmata archaeon]|nr:DUF106 domain-containing protein [Euryarchaeota archaeon]RLF67136.1 MAG: hypothetical protein DRN30_00690 [Thermoplasmata archaeon]